MLLWLYTSLLDPEYLAVKPTTLHKWRAKGTLVDNIKKAFAPLPAPYRGEEYFWFLKNKGVVSGTQDPVDNTDPVEPEGPVLEEESLRRARCFIGKPPTTPTDDIKQHVNSMSKQQVECFNLYARLLSGLHPVHDLGYWYQTGFCVCKSREDEMSLAQSYNSLIHRCTFDEFRDAYSSSSLLFLFWRKGLTITIPSVVDAISSTPFSRSVWDLKQYIENKVVNEQESDTPILSVAVDYGFMNCTTAEEHRMLVNLYKDFFALGGKAHPVVLHGVCIQGRLFAYFTEDLMFRLNPEGLYKRLLKNPYPLPDI